MWRSHARVFCRCRGRLKMNVGLTVNLLLSCVSTGRKQKVQGRLKTINTSNTFFRRPYAPYVVKCRCP
ncbi:hypothetical protein [Kingella potus]|uniref:hypothetical protein n=1 Tax=Kingella potus TaxID=265175 RepID=UPI001FCF83C8|nr:hypothetical protein [Kingella potus]UOP01175.1 hypothetical protein LVJ84_02360 [Kingella potus]